MSTEVLLMSTHNICFRGEIRNISVVEKVSYVEL